VPAINQSALPESSPDLEIALAESCNRLADSETNQ
jgi:hypothetical protein